MDSVDALFSTLFSGAFLVILLMHAYAIVTALCRRPWSQNYALMLAGWALAALTVLLFALSAFFQYAELPNTAVTLVIGTIGWAVANFVLCMVMPRQRDRY